MAKSTASLIENIVAIYMSFYGVMIVEKAVNSISSYTCEVLWICHESLLQPLKTELWGHAYPSIT